VQQAILRLTSGVQKPCLLPTDAQALAAFIAGMQAPQNAGGKIFRLGTPDGAEIEVRGAEIAALEVPPPYRLIENFLPQAEWDRAMAHALAHEKDFLDATIALPGTDNPDTRFRRSRTLNDVAAVVPMVATRLHPMTADILRHLQMHGLPIRSMECQVTAHGDGDFFAVHTDNALPEIAHRRISYVYYFHREPKQFSGGHLRLYNTLLEGGFNACGTLAADIDPPGNGLIIFPSHCHHEVTPIQCVSTALKDQRLTINGWLCV